MSCILSDNQMPESCFVGRQKKRQARTVKPWTPPPKSDQVVHPAEREQGGQHDSKEEISQQDRNNQESRDNQHEISEDNNE